MCLPVFSRVLSLRRASYRATHIGFLISFNLSVYFTIASNPLICTCLSCRLFVTSMKPILCTKSEIHWAYVISCGE